jgi:hypothetical protein
MLTAQAALIIAGVAFVAVAITGSQQFVQIKIPELGLKSRWALGITGAGFFACAFVIPTVTGQSSGQTPAASTPQGGGSPSNSQLPVLSQPSKSASPRPTSEEPTVIIDTPRNSTQVPESGFTTTGTVSSLGTGVLWLFDYDQGTAYTIDEPVSVTLSGKWQASDGPFGKSDPSVTIAIVVANRSCNNELNQLNGAGKYNVSALPAGCKVVAETTVEISRS